MNPFTLLYLLYSAKLSSQASIYFIWLVASSSRTIAYIAAAVAVLAGFPFFHVIVHVFSAKPLSNPIFIAYLSFSFLLAILWYKPTQDGEQRVLPFAVVTAFDLLDLFIFLFQQQIGHWQDALTSDVERGHLRVQTSDSASVALVGRGNKQVRHDDLGATPVPSENEIRRLQIMQDLGYDVNAINRSGRAVGDYTDFDPRSAGEQSGVQVSDGRGLGQTLDDREAGARSAGAKVAAERPGSVRWDSGMLQNWHEREMEEADLNPRQGQSGFFIDLGVGAGSRFENPPSPQTPATVIFNNTHPVYRPTLDDDPRPPSARILEQNQI